MSSEKVSQPCVVCGKFSCRHLSSGFDLATPGTDTTVGAIIDVEQQPDAVARHIVTVGAQVREAMKGYVGDRSDLPRIQEEIDKIVAKEGFPPGSIILVDDAPTADFKFPVPMTLEHCNLECLEPMRIAPDSLEVHTWELDYAQTDCGTACTPNGCWGHESNIPESLTIGFTVLRFEEDLDEWQAGQAVEVGKYLARMIQDAKELRRTAELIVDSNHILPGKADLTTKTAVRTREQLLRCIEKGYRIFFDHEAGVQFLRCPGRPDINYEL